MPSLPTLQPLDLYRRTLACLVLAVSCLGGGGLWADDARTSVEQRSNAVSQVLLGIFSYVRWPKEPAVLKLCVVGPTEYADGLLRGMVQANGRRVHAERRAVDNPDLGTLCNVIYLGVVDERERQQVFRSLAGHPVLSISERGTECSVGSMFCLNVGGPRITFEANLDSIARSGVRVHPSVLKLARRQATP
ncbi:TPA: diguanylate cyclase inhibitor YfiR [Pseudomonas aeruginosa]|nr:diguanylate cyclase inhibitor YfiR [Pseudomonas aeruginosa]HEP8567128.1 diguanylate cyclase inhibitor YfiR [Pseudomonas aeruginosa]HEP8579434.1 diguanylate cyclase inhibitor YfiR [Pseudomonas aeruginosa]